MKTTISILLAAVLAVSCRGRNTVQRGQQNYEVVQEGQATGVTSTINGPGETPPPLTNTSADTTTAFTALPNGPIATTTVNQPGSLGATLPEQTGTYYPGNPRPRVAPRPQPATPPPPMTSGTPTTTTQPQPAPVPPPQVEPQPPTTDTTTSTAPPPPEEKKSEEPEPQPEPQPQPPPPPPPTPQT